MERTKAILVVEDDEKRRDLICNRLLDKGESRFAVIPFTNKIAELITVTQKSDDGIAIEEAILAGLKNYNVGLIVVDHDLSKYELGTSESAFTAASHLGAIPVCRYHRRSSAATPPLWQLNSKVFSIDVDPDGDFGDEFVKKIIEVFDGFVQIADKYQRVSENLEHAGPAEILANILGKPGLKSHFSLYTTGVSFFNDSLASRSSGEDIEERMASRVPYVLGYWLYNSILEFPGVLLNETATASYLNVDPEHLNLVEKILIQAEYKGPFSRTRRFWWRSELDSVLGDSDDIRENDQVRKLNRRIPPCLCSKSMRSPAGFYDVLSRKPISAEESVGNISWIPVGANLTRVATDEYEELEPLLGY